MRVGQCRRGLEFRPCDRARDCSAFSLDAATMEPHSKSEVVMKSVPLAAAVLIICFNETSSAQLLRYFSPSGAYLTAPVRKALDQARATEFSRAASSAGFTAKETRAIATGLREGKLTLVPGSVPMVGAPTASTAKFETPLGTVPLTNTQQLSLVGRMLDVIQYSWFFQKYATIHITVTPAPPLDYKILINGESCEPTQSSTYELPPGEAVVTVTRSGKQPCAWTGVVSRGQLQDVACKL
jgi:hypothetical protein